MKVIAINGSIHPKGNTNYAIETVANELRNEGIEVEILTIGGENILGCKACGACFKSRNEECIIKNDNVNLYIQKIKDADGIILGSPVHYTGISATMKCFLDRAFYVAGANGSLFRHKIGTSVVAVRRSGGITTFQQLNNYINYCEMLMPTTNYWPVIHGTVGGDAAQDIEGTQTMRILGKNMAWLLKMKEATKTTIIPPSPEKKIYTNFIR